MSNQDIGIDAQPAQPAQPAQRIPFVNSIEDALRNVAIAELASREVQILSKHVLDCDCANCCLCRTESARQWAVIAVTEFHTRLLEAMIPGKAMTTWDIASQYYFDNGRERLGHDAINAALSTLSHDHAEGREVQICADYKSWIRPIAPGIGATYSVGSDRHACTVVAVSKTGRKITVRDDKVTRTDYNGMSEDQRYVYERDRSGAEQTFYRDASGRYGNKTRGGQLTLGIRREYHDYSF